MSSCSRTYTAPTPPRPPPHGRGWTCCDREGLRGRVVVLVKGRQWASQVVVGGGGQGGGARADGQGAPQGARAEDAGAIRQVPARAQGQAQLGKLLVDLGYSTVNLGRGALVHGGGSA